VKYSDLSTRPFQEFIGEEKYMCLAVPGNILSIVGDDPIFRSGQVNFGGIVKEINLSYVPEAKKGDYVLVHVGFALSIVNQDEAEKTLAFLRQMGELDELETDAV
jgi:hydrogenase expression/formation protein HypC